MALVPTCAPSFARYTLVGPWCWVGPSFSLARQMLFYIPLYVVYATITVIYLHIASVTLLVRRNVKASAGSGLVDRSLSVKRFLAYPIGEGNAHHPNHAALFLELDTAYCHTPPLVVPCLTRTPPRVRVIASALHLPRRPPLCLGSRHHEPPVGGTLRQCELLAHCGACILRLFCRCESHWSRKAT